PRQLQQDLDACRDQNVSIVFAPEHDEMYNNQNYFSIQIDSLNQYMCGGSRPGFFEGVCLVVNKLFNIIQPDLAVFGQKDIQQFLILKRMTKEFNHPVEMIMAPIVRANDGLALSSRNAYLSDHERMIAPGLFRSLQYLQKQIEGGVITPKLLIEHQKNELEAKGFKIDYLNVFSRATLQPVKTLTEQTKYLIAGAVWLGTTRLIDNILIEI
ncbi:MAG: pantoate--beta-alanine ligase, partial [Balneolaceae bacterium]